MCISRWVSEATSCRISRASEQPRIFVLKVAKVIAALTAAVHHHVRCPLQEEVLIEEDNKAHVAAWQVQLADMKARQAAAVAAARAGSLPGAIGSQPAAAHSGSLLPTQAGPTTPVVAAAAAAVGGAASAGGLGRKRSWGDLQQQANGRDVKMARFAAGTFDGGSTAAGARSRAGLHQQQQQQGRIRHEDHEALLLASVARQRAGTGVNTAAGGAASRAVSHQAGKGIVLKGSSPTAELKSAGRSGAPSGGSSKKKKASARDMAAKLLGVAARAAAAAAPPRRCCLVHLQPANRQQSSSSSLKVAAGEARQGRGRKQPSQLAQQHAQRLQQQWQEGEQRYSAPDVDQPYLSCPLEVTVSSLKELLLQQLRQQGASDWGSSSLEDVQLLLAKPGGAAAASGGDGGAAAGVLGDGLTVGQLFEQWWGVGPELQVQYRLLVKA